MKVKLLKGRHFRDALKTPGSPKIEKYHFASKVAKMMDLPIKRLEGEVGSRK